MISKQVFSLFDQALRELNSNFSATIIGGSALYLLGFSARVTLDIDIIDPRIDQSILEVAEKLRIDYPELNLPENWLNNGPENLKQDLVSGWEDRTIEIYKGDFLTFKTLGRLDLVQTKLFAYLDRDVDLKDLISLKVTQDEINISKSWLIARDGNLNWKKHVEKRLVFLLEQASGS